MDMAGGMTDKQFASHRRQELDEFENMLKIAKKTNADEELVEKIEKFIKRAKADIEV